MVQRRDALGAGRSRRRRRRRRGRSLGAPLKAPADIVRSIIRARVCPFCLRGDGLKNGVEKDRKGAVTREWVTCLACNSTWDTEPKTTSSAR